MRSEIIRRMRLNRLERIIPLGIIFLLYIAFFKHLLEQLLVAIRDDTNEITYSIPNDLFREHSIIGLLLITSYTEHKKLRAAHRAAISQRQLDDLGFVRVFLLGQVSGENHHSVSQEHLREEQQRHGDLLQGHFKDDYRSNNYKAFMGLVWAYSNCAYVDFVIKLNDDVVFDVYYLHRYLIRLPNKFSLDLPNFLAGKKVSDQLPQRGEGHKFYVTHEEYNGTVYPNYVSGSMYITTLPTVRHLIEEAVKEPAFWIDDIWITGILREKLKIPITELNSWFLNDSRYLKCCVRDRKRHYYECGYYVGPLEGKPNLLVEFLHNVRICYYEKCIERLKNRSVLETCTSKAKISVGAIQKHCVNTFDINSNVNILTTNTLIVAIRFASIHTCIRGGKKTVDYLSESYRITTWLL